MSEHTCTTLTRGCYRCDLGVDEMRHQLAEMRSEVIGVDVAIEVLMDHRRELTDSIVESSRAVDTWDMFSTTPTEPTR